MPSIFHSEKTVTVDGVDYRIEADETIEGTQFFKVTNQETGVTNRCTRKGNAAKLDGGMSSMSDEHRRALEVADEVEII